MRYGFVIDQNRCIGCHACTVACKEEHNIPIGVNRTWVKYIEKGNYPDTRRHFAVLRCNHCDDAPCIEICPTVALFRRPDGIVDFDNERCIGCKSCMQACPYDALYIDPERNTAAKCNFDASRVEMGYKPACEVVCPTQAILSGDLDDPNSAVSKRIALEKVSVRKAEKGTKPKLFYVGVEGDLLNPTMMEPQSTHLWAEKDPGEDLYALKSVDPNRPIPGVAREVYDVPHMIPWGKKIASYLWTKAISAGVLLLAALFLNMGFDQDIILLGLIAPLISMVFLGATMALLVFDLKKPGRFFFLLTKPNLNSWLTLGGYVLMIFGVLAGGVARANVPPRHGFPMGVVARSAVCDRFCGLFRFSFRSGARARLLAKPAAVLAFGRKGDQRRRGRADSHRFAGTGNAVSIHEPADVLLADQYSRHILARRLGDGLRRSIHETWLGRSRLAPARFCSADRSANHFGFSSSAWASSFPPV